ncbi:hypothetical protein OJ997_21180 [Solirubrobacter phytolaccae]|uniref:TPM domain-containing protein n=1 Tax=Solirubrobacter phytolaccae TaxID=1404360 RepID=A0A9X3S909_9ACTN|nr:hypothetical protein [Solirubrobacter phytolaccae]MDA0182839.1 hypothetical protein [Solirubrobacter phytolaccae]
MPRRLVVPAIALALVCSGGGNALAADRTDLFVAALKESPVYVSDSVSRRIDDADREALLRDVERMPFPTFVVVAPDLSSETIYGDDRLALLRDGLGRDGLYVVSDDRGSLVYLSAYGVQLPMRDHDIEQATYNDYDRDDPGIDKLRYALALARGEARMPRSERAVIPPDEGGPVPTPYREPEEDDERTSSAALGFSILGAFFAGVALSATGLERRYRRRRARGRRGKHATPAADTRTRAVDTHAKLAREIARKRAPDERAVDLEVAASMALDRQGKPIDDLGALVLAQRGREALAGKERERCFFDPRHSGWAKPTRWQSDRAMVEVPACKRCAQAVAAGRAPESAWDGDRPYWQRDTVWARTGFGTLRRDMRRALAEDRR